MTETNLSIPKSIINEVFEHAKSGLPNETCGYLVGKEMSISAFYPMTNVDETHDHFSFDPKEQFAAMKRAREENVELLVVYHSHPSTPPRLSEEDVTLLNDPNTIYLIVSLQSEKPEAKAYWLKKPNETTINITQVDLSIV